MMSGAHMAQMLTRGSAPYHEVMRLEAYLAKIGVTGPHDPGVATLRRLHLAHRETFLFENLSIQRGAGISLALPDLERKFLDEGCGGYCFEHNTLFAAALRSLGFRVVALLARVRSGPPDGWMRTHMILRVVVDGQPWLADVGFGGFGLLEPLPLADGATAEQGSAWYALRRDPALWVLSMRTRSTNADLYEFTEDPQTAADMEVANHYTATHAASRFRRTLTIQRSSVAERLILRSDSIVRLRGGEVTEQPIDPSQLRPLARQLFGIELSEEPFVFERDAALT